jgi:hypothetical protein
MCIKHKYVLKFEPIGLFLIPEIYIIQYESHQPHAAI